jgi:hypothetical protein
VDARTIESRLKELCNGAEMATTPQIVKYTGASPDWVKDYLRANGVASVGRYQGMRWHIRDVAKALATQSTTTN